MAQWIRHRPTEPGIVGSSPTGVSSGSGCSTGGVVFWPAPPRSLSASHPPPGCHAVLPRATTTAPCHARPACSAGKWFPAGPGRGDSHNHADHRDNHHHHRHLHQQHHRQQQRCHDGNTNNIANNSGNANRHQPHLCVGRGWGLWSEVRRQVRGRGGAGHGHGGCDGGGCASCGRAQGRWHVRAGRPARAGARRFLAFGDGSAHPDACWPDTWRIQGVHKA